ncbi:putative leucine-rich repeat-containing protein DDB_G0290503 [Glossina fuscipes]|uniref:Leucine-rich repeat-containing protein DDB_G0290503 n=1 Tax=Glossina fuscipes TaxID=7396 RepID=A0A8U0WLF6_9MUSC|nr:putative leucine-rich repeat-containing protein DDB_G0290503 [Glossina fuscipes]KAI9589688.1 hypothetical protein GQX74_007856 [Glossina fuscipes]
MSLKKDPSLRVAANDPHLVSLGGGRLSTAVTIHYIPIGETTVGSSTGCCISLNGPGVRSLHCTISRSRDNRVTMQPEQNARVLIDGQKIVQNTNLTQGAMITIGNSYYLRFNNPAEAQLMRSVIESQEDISVIPQIIANKESKDDFSHKLNSIIRNDDTSSEMEGFQRDQCTHGIVTGGTNDRKEEPKFKANAYNHKVYNNLAPAEINELHCPKVFTSDLVTVNMPAKDVLGKKYKSFAKNLIENHRNEKNICNTLLNNQVQNCKLNTTVQLSENKLVNIPTNNVAMSQPTGTEFLTKVNNISSASPSHRNAVNAYERYPKPGAYGGFQIFPMNCINSEMNNSSSSTTNVQDTQSGSNEQERLEDMLKICTEYADRQNQSCNSSLTSSPIVQNRIKTNGSLPRDKKSPFYYDFSGGQLQQSLSESNRSLSEDGNLERSHCVTNIMNTNNGYENIRIIGQNRIEAINQSILSPKSGYENVVVAKSLPQSPRTKIRTTCMSPKKDNISNNIIKQADNTEYDQLIKNFEEKFNLEIQAIEESSRCQPQAISSKPSIIGKSNRNINNLTLNLKIQAPNSPKPNKKPAPAPRTTLRKGQFSVADTNHISDELRNDLPNNSDINEMKSLQTDLLNRMQILKSQISELQKQEKETLQEISIESSLVPAVKLQLTEKFKNKLQEELQTLQNKVHRLEAQRNATRVMDENKQAKLKQSIEMKQDQMKRLKEMLQQKPKDVCLKEELIKLSDSLENDRKTFEDLEFQYLEGESEWHAYREELHAEEKALILKIEEKRIELQHIERQLVNNYESTTKESSFLNNQLLTVLKQLKNGQDHLKTLENNFNNASVRPEKNSPSPSSYSVSSEVENAETINKEENNGIETTSVMSQSLFDSTELLCTKHNNTDVMSKSINENIFFNDNIESPYVTTSVATNFDADIIKVSSIEGSDKAKCGNVEVACNLTLDCEIFEVNPLNKKVPSQDDIDRISKLTSDTSISATGANTKIFDSIKEIERNRQLLLTQQGHYVIEHERQKMNDLKQKIHDEACAQYIANLSYSDDANNSNEFSNATEHSAMCGLDSQNKENIIEAEKYVVTINKSESCSLSQQQRHSHPEYEGNNREKSNQNKSRPLSEANSELSYEMLSEQATCKSSNELSPLANCRAIDGDEKCSVSLNSEERSTSMNNDNSSGRKRILPKHQRPLTRYLPIFSAELNLRQHIESAGHQISLCPHVFIDSYSCRGYLHKLGATFHGWSRRWFVLDRQSNAFIYYADKSERKPRGGAYFSTIDEVYLDHLNASKSGRPHCTFIVKTKKRSYHLQAASGAAARIWIDAIITGAQGNLDY